MVEARDAIVGVGRKKERKTKKRTNLEYKHVDGRGRRELALSLVVKHLPREDKDLVLGTPKMNLLFISLNM